DQSLPLAMQVPKRLAHRGPRRDDTSLFIQPCSKLGEQRWSLASSSIQALHSVVARKLRCAFDPEERRDLVHPLKTQAVSRARRLDQPAATVRPAARALSARALNEGEDVRAIALDRASLILAQEVLDRVAVATHGVAEAHPQRVRPHPHRARADTTARFGIQNCDATGVRAEQTWSASLRANEIRDGRQQIRVRAHAAPQRLRRDGCALATEARALTLGRLVFEELI